MIQFFLVFFILQFFGTFDASAIERDPLQSRVPSDLIKEAQAIVNPLEVTPENIQLGKELFEGFALCSQCHGITGKGDGAVAVNRGLDPSPRDFTNPEFHKARTDGELFWVVNNGSPGTAMPKMTGAGMINEEQAWHVILYIRTFPQQVDISSP